jgi:2-isopropylmalate synthase
MKMKLKMTPDEVVAQAVHSVKRATKYTDNIEFSPEDAGRSDLDFLCRIIEATINAGATTINIPDTVGYNIPHQFGETMRQLIERVPNSDKAIFSAHCHNDLGLAVSNSLSAALNGARQIECTINGLGERAGNTSLEEVVMAIRTRQDVFNFDTDINAEHILAASRLVSSITGFVVQPNKAIVGANAFAHEAGIHQDGVLKHRETYEIMRAEDVGWNANKLVLGKHSGRNAFKSRLGELGVEFDSEATLNDAFARFKDLADKKHDIFDEDLQALVTETQAEATEVIRLLSLKVCTETGEENTAEVSLSINGEEKSASAKTSGAVDATFHAILSMVDIEPTLQLYSVTNVTEGTDALGEVNVRLEHKGVIVNGQGVDTDIITSSAKAYIHALNKVMDHVERAHPQI